jgi:predicted RNA-binding protein (virulence factor B family)
LAEIGKNNQLQVVRSTDNGIYLDGENLGEILMPKKYITEEITESGSANVFVYTDSEDRLVATTETPLAKVGEFACLKVKETTQFGAFLDWGLEKDLLVPFREQAERMREGNSYCVFVYLDLISKRVVASAKLKKFLDNTPPQYESGQEVNILVADQTEMGYKAIVNNEHFGMLYQNQVFKPLKIGQITKAYIAKIRDDEKIDLQLEKSGYGKIDNFAKLIIEELKRNNGFLAVSDKTSPEIIKGMFGMSKKNFKKALGALYKQQMIDFNSDGIRLQYDE